MGQILTTTHDIFASITKGFLDVADAVAAINQATDNFNNASNQYSLTFKFKNPSSSVQTALTAAINLVNTNLNRYQPTMFDIPNAFSVLLLKSQPIDWDKWRSQLKSNLTNQIPDDLFESFCSSMKFSFDPNSKDVQQSTQVYQSSDNTNYIYSWTTQAIPVPLTGDIVFISGFGAGIIEDIEKAPVARMFIVSQNGEEFLEVSPKIAAFVEHNAPNIIRVNVLGTIGIGNLLYGNIKGSQCDRRASWIALWEKTTGLNRNQGCSDQGCNNPVVGGGHVFFKSQGDNWYITPICSTHNSSGFDGNNTMKGKTGNIWKAIQIDKNPCVPKHLC